jgi:hypothetical protein
MLMFAFNSSSSHLNQTSLTWINGHVRRSRSISILIERLAFAGSAFLLFSWRLASSRQLYPAQTSSLGGGSVGGNRRTRLHHRSCLGQSFRGFQTNASVRIYISRHRLVMPGLRQRLNGSDCRIAHTVASGLWVAREPMLESRIRRCGNLKIIPPVGTVQGPEFAQLFAWLQPEFYRL